MRVWDKKRQVMTHLPPLMPMAMLDGTFLGMLSTIPEQPIADVQLDGGIKASDYVVMYGTGKLDSAGADLFDGDIVECDVKMLESIGSDAVARRKGVIGWQATAMGFTVFLNHRDGEAPAEYSVGNITKLGNVWQDPEKLADFEPVIEDVSHEKAVVPKLKKDCGISDPNVRCKLMRCKSCDAKPTENKK